MHAWFHLHRALQLLGMVLFVAGFALAIKQFGGRTSGQLGGAHRAFGIAIFAATCLQARALPIKTSLGLDLWLCMLIPDLSDNGRKDRCTKACYESAVMCIIKHAACMLHCITLMLNETSNGAAQILVAFVRPAPASALRPFFNFSHHWLGRLLLLSAWSNLYIGAVLYHSVTLESAAPWIAAASAALGAILVADALLSCRFTDQERKQLDEGGANCANGAAPSSAGSPYAVRNGSGEAADGAVDGAANRSTFFWLPYFLGGGIGVSSRKPALGAVGSSGGMGSQASLADGAGPSSSASSALGQYGISLKALN